MRFKNIKYGILSILLIVSIQSCTYFNTGSVRYAERKDKAKGVYLLGFIENRDSHFDPFSTKNLSSMLKFELLFSGYDVLVIGDYLKTIEDNVAKEKAFKKEKSTESKDNTNFLPDSAKNVAGENFWQNIELDPRNLKEQEIKNLSGTVAFDFFIQGAISMNDNRKILDKKESAIIFLEVFDKKGKIISSVNYTVEDRTFTEANLLRDVCTKIVDKLDKREEKKNWMLLSLF
ncbi:putative lipoprotein [Leptospira inadai serovar Lyme str. 10]|uniref:Lipoprotein n=2 Tax=Leptospira inadai serovar Lyme TaxID=293084 RepID=A0ABX4YMM4_9LEPT|nr:lipoprotein [Leptospira inadai]EQA38121.1 putative lipoprotein [Leptospira inadai serovar Lyme str. 10]PNV76518.1 lipoprotein [Leptospira inadai serovar Lyme]